MPPHTTAKREQASAPVETAQLFADNPALAARIAREAMIECLKDDAFRRELVQAVALSIRHEPIEPLYDFSLAAKLIPVTFDRLKQLTHKYKNDLMQPAQYRLVGRAHRRVRLLSASDIQTIRRKVHRFKGQHIERPAYHKASEEPGAGDASA